MTKSKISKTDREALVARGFVEGQPNTIPENISPVLKAQLLAEMDEDASGSTPGEAGGPEALAARNERRDVATERDPLDHDNNGRKGGVAAKK